MVTFMAEISVQNVEVCFRASNSWQQTADRELMDPGESDCLIKTKQRDSLNTGLPSLWFLPSALNVKVMRFNQAQVNGGSNYDSLKVAKCLVI